MSTDPDYLPDDIKRIFAAKKEWHRTQAALPLREKVRILLEMQKQDYPILKARCVLQACIMEVSELARRMAHDASVAG